MDVKLLRGRIPEGDGRRTRRGQIEGYAFIHPQSPIIRYVYSEILPDEAQAGVLAFMRNAIAAVAVQV
jgi:hypothetical protein